MPDTPTKPTTIETELAEAERRFLEAGGDNYEWLVARPAIRTQLLQQFALKREQEDPEKIRAERLASTVKSW